MASRQRACAGHRAYLAGNISAGVYGYNSRCVRGFACIDAFDFCVRVHRSQKGDVKLVGKFDVIDIVAEALDQPGVFGALNSLSDVFSHDGSP